jgi:hypothetical protein
LTPLTTTDQNGSDAWPWVTTAIVMSPRSPPPPPSAADSVACCVHAAMTSASAASATGTFLMRMRSILHFSGVALIAIRPQG